MLPLIKSIVTRFTRPMIYKQPEPNYDRMDEWAHVELSYWAKHFTKATEMVLKQKNLLLCDVLTISEVNFLWAIAHYSKLAEEGEMVGEAVEAMMLANGEDVESIKKKVETEVNSYIGLSAKIKLCESGSIRRSEGKAVRVIDRRN